MSTTVGGVTSTEDNSTPGSMATNEVRSTTNADSISSTPTSNGGNMDSTGICYSNKVPVEGEELLVPVQVEGRKGEYTSDGESSDSFPSTGTSDSSPSTGTSDSSPPCTGTSDSSPSMVL